MATTVAEAESGDGSQEMMEGERPDWSARCPNLGQGRPRPGFVTGKWVGPWAPSLREKAALRRGILMGWRVGWLSGGGSQGQGRGRKRRVPHGRRERVESKMRALPQGQNNCNGGESRLISAPPRWLSLP